MTVRNASKLKWLEREVPEGLFVSARWLSAHGYSSSLRSQYVGAGWLEQPAHGVFRRPRGALRWEHVVISLQNLMQIPAVVGGRTALELQGYAHLLSRQQREVHLYTDAALPGWMGKLPLEQRFILHRGGRLFRDDPPPRAPIPGAPPGAPAGLSRTVGSPDGRGTAPIDGSSFTVIPWGQWDWPLTLSTPERAFLELLDELPGKESFHMVDKLAEGLVGLSPSRLARLLADCRSIKVKRLFFFFADRHKPAWRGRLDPMGFDLGTGDRMLVRGGKLDPVYRITVPGDLDAV